MAIIVNFFVVDSMLVGIKCSEFLFSLVKTAMNNSAPINLANFCFPQISPNLWQANNIGFTLYPSSSLNPL